MSKLTKLLDEHVPDWSKCQMCRLTPFLKFHRVINGERVDLKLCAACYEIIAGKWKGKGEEKSYPLRLGDVVKVKGRPEGTSMVVVSINPLIAVDVSEIYNVEMWEVQRKGEWCPIFQKEESDDESN